MMVKTNKTKGYNSFAILALVFAFIFSPLGLVFGIIALGQIKKTGEKGKWMAWVPIWIGIIAIVLIVIGVIWAVINNITA